MRTRYEVGGGATAIGMGRRWLAVLLAFALGAALVALAASPARADNGTVNAEYLSHSGTLHATGGPIPDVVEAPDDGEFLQMQPTSHIVMEFTEDVAAPDGTADADLRIDTYDAPYPAIAKVKGSIDGDSWTLLATVNDSDAYGEGGCDETPGPDCGTDIDLDALGVGQVKYVKIVQDNDCEGVWDPDAGIEGIFYEDVCTSQRGGLGHLGFDLDAVVALNYEPYEPVDTCDPDIPGDCTATDDNGTTATIECLDEECPEIILAPAENPGEDAKASFDVLDADPGSSTVFSPAVMVVTMGSRALSTPPGRASVEFFPDVGDSYLLDNCNKTDDPNCIIKIKRVKGGLTQYIVRLEVDPRLDFK